MSDLDDLRSKASYKYDELIAVVKENGEKLDYIAALKERQYKNDSDQYDKWQEAKRKGHWVTMIQVSIGLMMLYLGVIDINQENPFVIRVNEILSIFTGWLV